METHHSLHLKRFAMNRDSTSSRPRRFTYSGAASHVPAVSHHSVPHEIVVDVRKSLSHYEDDELGPMPEPSFPHDDGGGGDRDLMIRSGVPGVPGVHGVPGVPGVHGVSGLVRRYSTLSERSSSPARSAADPPLRHHSSEITGATNSLSQLTTAQQQHHSKQYRQQPHTQHGHNGYSGYNKQGHRKQSTMMNEVAMHDLLAKWRSMAMDFSWLHQQSSEFFGKCNIGIVLPTMIMSTAAGALSFVLVARYDSRGCSSRLAAADSTGFSGNSVVSGNSGFSGNESGSRCHDASSSSINYALNLVSGILAITSAALATLQNKCKFGERSARHKSSADEFDKLSREISVAMLITNTKGKTYANIAEFIKECNDRFNRLIERSPSVPDRVFNRLKRLKKEEFEDELEKERQLQERHDLQDFHDLQDVHGSGLHGVGLHGLGIHGVGQLNDGMHQHEHQQLHEHHKVKP